MITHIAIICGGIAIFVIGVEIGISVGIKRYGKLLEQAKFFKRGAEQR